MNIHKRELEALFKEQLVSWESAGSNYRALENVVVKEIELNSFSFKVQFNPARIVSSSAKVDTKSIKERACFLCEENRPSIQRGIEYIYNNHRFEPYTILINPFPIFPRHLTIPLRQHKDQLISGRMGVMLALSKELDEFTLFYNGPKCGASAPDHFHFQAGNRGFLTVEKELYNLDREIIYKNDSTTISSIKGPFNGLFSIESSSAVEAESLFETLFALLPLKEQEQEPMVNILTWYSNDSYTILIFVREKHRPSHYFAEDEANILLSPASVDLGGVFITPLEKDFHKMNATLIAEILNEVCISKEINNRIIDSLKKELV